jgi:serine protease Do
MKTNLFLNIIFSIFGMIGCGKTIAQEIKDSKESQEIIIKKKGDKDAKIIVEITGNSIIVNGKPLAEFKEDGITINNRKMIIREGKKITMMFDEQQMPMLENIEGLEDMQIMMNGVGDMDKMEINTTDQKRVVLGVMTDTKENEGAVITEVVKDGPASKIGLQKDDVINKIDDTKIATFKELSNFIQTKKEGDKVKVYFTRAGKKMDATATLEMRNAMKEVKVIRRGFSNRGMEDMEMQNDGDRDVRVFKYKNDGVENAVADMRNRQKDLIFKMMGPKLGIKIQDTELENGVKVLDVEKESLSATAGLQKDDIIVAIADKAIKNTDEAREALNENRKKSSYTIKVKRNDKDVLLTITVPKKLKTANL